MRSRSTAIMWSSETTLPCAAMLRSALIASTRTPGLRSSTRASRRVFRTRSCGSAPLSASRAFSRTAAFGSVCTAWQSTSRTSGSSFLARRRSTASSRTSGSKRSLLRRIFRSTLFTLSLLTVPCTRKGCCARICNSTWGGWPPPEGITLIPATCALCISIGADPPLGNCGAKLEEPAASLDSRRIRIA